MGKVSIQMKEITEKRRVVYLDLIRIVAVYLVIFTHTGDLGSKLYEFGDYGFIRNIIYIMADVIRRINVPLFLMVSGAVLLGREESTHDVLRKRVIKYGLVTIVMSYFYYVFHYNEDALSLKLFFIRVYQGNIIGLFWFLYAYIGYLLILPFLRKMLKNMERSDFFYFIILGIGFKSIFPFIGMAVGVGNIAVSCCLVTDIVFYPVLGHFLHCVMTEKFSNKIYILGGFAAFSCIAVVTAMTFWEGRSGEYSERYYDTFNVIPTIYAFMILKRIGGMIEKSRILNSIIYWLGNCSFGVYVFSIYIQLKLIWVYRSLLSWFPGWPLICSFIYVGVVMLTGVVVVSILKLIPGIKRLF